MSATIPLLLEEDVESGLPPSYEEAANGKRTLQNRPLQHHWFFNFNSSKATTNLTAVIFSPVAIRLEFLRKVFGILSLQLLITAVLCTTLYVTPEVRLFLQQQLWIVLASVIGSFILLFAMFIHSRSVPLNYILLVSWTIMQSITIGAVVSFFDVKVIIEAVGLTAVTVAGLFVYTLQSKRDFQSHWAALFSVSIVFLAVCFANLVLQSELFDFLMAAFGAVLFSIYLIFDIDRIIHHTSPEDYIEARSRTERDMSIVLAVKTILGGNQKRHITYTILCDVCMRYFMYYMMYTRLIINCCVCMFICFFGSILDITQDCQDRFFKNQLLI